MINNFLDFKEEYDTNISTYKQCLKLYHTLDNKRDKYWCVELMRYKGMQHMNKAEWSVALKYFVEIESMIFLCMYVPPGHLPYETIKQLLESYIASCEDK